MQAGDAQRTFRNLIKKAAQKAVLALDDPFYIDSRVTTMKDGPERALLVQENSAKATFLRQDMNFTFLYVDANGVNVSTPTVELTATHPH